MRIVRKNCSILLILPVITVLLAVSGCADSAEPGIVFLPVVKAPQVGSVIAGLKLNTVFKDQEKLLLRNDRHTVTMNAGKQCCYIDTVPVFLNEPVIFADNQWQISSVTAETFLDPILNDRLPVIRTILIDPGHGGRDTGAISVKNDFEKDLNLLLAEAVGEELKKAGYTVYFTRSDDTFLSLDRRPELIVEYNADLFISIHHNSAANINASGHEVYILKEETPEENRLIAESAGVAFAIEYSLAREMKSTVRGVKTGRFKVLRLARCPAILIETAFLSNSTDAVLAADENYRKAFAGAVAKALGAPAGISQQ